jgi:hypothetical protein
MTTEATLKSIGRQIAHGLHAIKPSDTEVTDNAFMDHDSNFAVDLVVLGRMAAVAVAEADQVDVAIVVKALGRGADNQDAPLSPSEASVPPAKP